ncbi:uncharacterized protein [Triticum aestivum]|uniref:uncharacterized protein isoform X1 n=1 Tax=Triticum aestivum TaxID=4565 RepID=UPI001D0266C6|nr:uncharacterized protein LOC123102297 isoform X1 [Triticum aestivum]
MPRQQQTPGHSRAQSATQGLEASSSSRRAGYGRAGSASWLLREEMANQQRQEIPATDLRSAPHEGMLLAGRGRGILSWSAAFTSVASDSGTSGAGGCNGFYTMPVMDNRCMVGSTMAKRGRTEGSGFRVGRRGRHCLYLSASCNHLLVASDNDFRWRGPYKWHAQCFTDLKQGATITLCSDWLP